MGVDHYHEPPAELPPATRTCDGGSGLLSIGSLRGAGR
jgi:hypothetical protein